MKQHSKDQRSLLDCFSEIYGLGKVTIAGFQCPLNGEKWVESMKASYSTLWEILHRAKTYVRRASKEIEAGRIYEAAAMMA